MAGTFLDHDGLLRLHPAGAARGDGPATPDWPTPWRTSQEAIQAALHALRLVDGQPWAALAERRAHWLQACEVVALEAEDADEGLRLAERHDLAPAAGTLLALARRSGCSVLCTTALRDGWSAAGLGLRVRASGQRRALPAAAGPARAAVRLRHLYERPGFLLRRAHQISEAVFENAFASVGLTPAQFSVLTVLQARSGLDQSRLARAIGLDKVTVSHLLRGLEQRGLVMRCPGVEDRRSLVLSLTPAALELLDRAEPCAEVAYRQFLAPLDAVQQQGLLGLLDALNTALDPLARAPFTPAG